MPLPAVDFHTRSDRPEPGEFAAYAATDVAAVEGDDAVEALTRLAGDTVALFQGLAEPAARGMTYAPGKWTLKEVATLVLLRGLPSTAWARRGRVNGYTCSVRGLAFHIAGHEMPHHRTVRERYGAGT